MDSRCPQHILRLMQKMPDIHAVTSELFKLLRRIPGEVNRPAFIVVVRENDDRAYAF